MKKRPYALLPLALAISLAACQPGSTPVQNTAPSAIPAPRSSDTADGFGIKISAYIDGYCGMPKDDWGFTQMPGAAIACYNQGGFPRWDQLPVEDGKMCLSFRECDLPGSDDDTGSDNNTCSSSEGRLCRIATGGQHGNVSLELSSPYFSPNGDGVKDSVDIQIEDPDEEGWTLEIKRDGIQARPPQQGKGSASISWDGANQPEGRYNVVMKLKQAPNLRLPLILDVTPPTVAYKSVKRYDGRADLQAVVTEPCEGGGCAGLDADGISFSTSDALSLQSVSVANASPRRVVYGLDILIEDNPGGFQTQFAKPFSILQENSGGRVFASGQDLAGNSLSDAGFQLAGLSCRLQSGGTVTMNTANKHQFEVVIQNGQPVCRECAHGQRSSGQNMFNSTCKPFKCSKHERLSNDGHSCVPAGSESEQDPPKPPLVFPAEGEAPCPSSGGNYSLGAVFDFDTHGPDLTMVVIPQKNGEVISGSDIQVRANAPGISPSVSLLNQVHPKNAATTLGGATGRQAQAAWERGQKNNNQLEVNRAFNLLQIIDAAVPSAIQVGRTADEQKDVLNSYDKNSPVLAQVVRGIQNLGYTIPDNLFNPKDSRRGYVYLFSADLNKNGADLSALTSVGQSNQIIIQVKGETIPLNLERKTDGVNWRARCAQ